MSSEGLESREGRLSSDPLSLCFLKQSPQRTGLSPRGWKGTESFLPQLEQVISNICLGPPPPRPPSILAFLACLHEGHLTGAFWNPLD